MTQRSQADSEVPSHPNGLISVHFSSVAQCVQLFATPWTAVCQASLSITNSWSLPKLMSMESVMPSNHLILCRPFLLPPSMIPSIRVFSNESVLLIRWLEYWSFSISPSSEYSVLISSRMDWLDLLAVQGTPQFSTVASLIYIPTKSTGGFPSLHSLDVYSLIFITLTKMPSRNVSHVTLPKAYEKPCLLHLHQQQVVIL